MNDDNVVERFQPIVTFATENCPRSPTARGVRGENGTLSV